MVLMAICIILLSHLSIIDGKELVLVAILQLGKLRVKAYHRIQYLFYINNLPEGLKSHVKLFADDSSFISDFKIRKHICFNT